MDVEQKKRKTEWDTLVILKPIWLIYIFNVIIFLGIFLKKICYKRFP